MLLKRHIGLGSPQRPFTLRVCGHPIISTVSPSILLLARSILLLALLGSATAILISLSHTCQSLDLEGDVSSTRSEARRVVWERRGSSRELERGKRARGAEVQLRRWRSGERGLGTSYTGSHQEGRGTWAGLAHFLLLLTFFLIFLFLHPPRLYPAILHFPSSGKASPRLTSHLSCLRVRQ